MDDLFRNRNTPLTEDQRLLRKQVLHQAETEPETFRMLDWESGDGCRTTRCIAGWAQYIARGAVTTRTVEWDAVALLGLTRDELRGQHDKQLFYTSTRDALARLRELCEDPA